MIWSPINRLLPKPKNVIPPPPVPLCEGDKGGGASSVFCDTGYNRKTLDSRLKIAGMTACEVFDLCQYNFETLNKRQDYAD